MEITKQHVRIDYIRKASILLSWFEMRIGYINELKEMWIIGGLIILIPKLCV